MLQKVLSLLFLLFLAMASQAKDQPNMIFILTDDAGYDDFGFTGCKDWKTPNIDALANKGVVFTDGYVSASVCGPSRAGLISGRYQQSFGHEENITGGLAKPVPSAEFGLPIEIPTIGNFLQKKGYKTAVFGKWHLGVHENFHPNKRGFDYFCGFIGGHRSFWPLKGAINPHHPHTLFENRVAYKTPEYLTDHLGKKCAEFIENNKDKPFFIYLSYNAVHSPLHCKTEDYEKLKNITHQGRRTLGAMTLALDDSIGHVMAALKKYNLADNTIVVFSNDNGAATYLKTDNGGLRGRKGTVWEGGLRVPYTVTWPKGLKAGQVSSTPVSTLDIASTFCSLAGYSQKEIEALKLDGQDLREAASANIKRPLFWKRGNTSAIRKGDWKLIVLKGEPTFLFNLSQDREEKVNLLDKNKTIASELSQALQNWEKTLPAPRWKKKLAPHYHKELLHYWK